MTTVDKRLYRIPKFDHALEKNFIEYSSLIKKFHRVLKFEHASETLKNLKVEKFLVCLQLFCQLFKFQEQKLPQITYRLNYVEFNI